MNLLLSSLYTVKTGSEDYLIVEESWWDLSQL